MSGAGFAAGFIPARLDAVLFDLDGVLTSTARTHARCWKRTFDEFLKARAARGGARFRPFDEDADYRRFVDGKPHYDGVRSFLASRGITLPAGSPESPPEENSVCGLGNRKDALFERALAGGQVHAYPGSIAFARSVRAVGMKTAVVSSSHHCAQVLHAAGIEALFDVRVDGVLLDRLKLRGKPAPDAYLHAAELLGVSAARAAVVEDALAGVQAGRAGQFGLVIGVDRGASGEALRENGADLVVRDLGELLTASAAGAGR